MQQIPWFSRKFDFSNKQNIFPAILERLTDTPLRLQHKLAGLSSMILTTKVGGQWSIQENLGHLIDLEPLWQGRLNDILLQHEYLRTADLSNTQTDQAAHNEQDITTLLQRFVELRRETMQSLRGLQEEEIFLSALHPRLHQPMRIMDLFLFVAEHDDHHLARMTYLLQNI
ncbi:MAG: DinB family protein [Bacteroidota bacterium]